MTNLPSIFVVVMDDRWGRFQFIKGEDDSLMFASRAEAETAVSKLMWVAPAPPHRIVEYVPKAPADNEV